MINAKKIYNTLLNDSRILEFVSEDNILNSYPNEVENFPCIIFSENSQDDSEYNDNMPGASVCSVEIHIFVKKLDGNATSSDIAEVVAEVMNEDFWNGSGNREVSDPDPDVEHRVIQFNKSIFN